VESINDQPTGQVPRANFPIAVSGHVALPLPDVLGLVIA